MYSNLKIEIPLGVTEILLHTCCAPCSSAIVECLMEHGLSPTLFYYNPNIFPDEEYEKRKAECIRHAKMLGLDFVDADYDHKKWLDAVKGLEAEPERGARCLQCFKERLTATALYAHEKGFKVFTTTLATSRWKSLEQIFEAGAYAESLVPEVKFWAQNWRKGGLNERRNELIREYGFYNQKYCGCEFSKRDESSAIKAPDGA
jgi:Uncharacterized protein conserved in bacteria